VKTDRLGPAGGVDEPLAVAKIHTLVAYDFLSAEQ
jgi:hypothetical protein